tara:strand:- start:7255 stop:7464 length:210 start_codon:yes stop_codon:yes gene_type:complete
MKSFSKENFIDKLFIDAINIMKTEDWKWPPRWDTNKINKFLNDSLIYAETNEFYEQCSIIRDVKKTIKA